LKNGKSLRENLRDVPSFNSFERHPIDYQAPLHGVSLLQKLNAKAQRRKENPRAQSKNSESFGGEYYRNSLRL
jgi:hypothetical protein